MAHIQSSTVLSTGSRDLCILTAYPEPRKRLEVMWWYSERLCQTDMLQARTQATSPARAAVGHVETSVSLPGTPASNASNRSSGDSCSSGSSTRLLLSGRYGQPVDKTLGVPEWTAAAPVQTRLFVGGGSRFQEGAVPSTVPWTPCEQSEWCAESVVVVVLLLCCISCCIPRVLVSSTLRFLGLRLWSNVAVPVCRRS